MKERVYGLRGVGLAPTLGRIAKLFRERGKTDEALNALQRQLIILQVCSH